MIRTMIPKYFFLPPTYGVKCLTVDPTQKITLHISTTLTLSMTKLFF